MNRGFMGECLIALALITTMPVIGFAQIAQFEVRHDSEATAGEWEMITITAQDAGGGTVTDYTGTITVETDGTAASINWQLDTGDPGGGTFQNADPTQGKSTYIFVSGDKGVVKLEIKDTAVERITITVTDTGAKTGTSSELNVIAGGIAQFEVRHDGEATAGEWETITITAQDAGGGTVTDYTDTITVETDGTAASINWQLETGGGTFQNADPVQGKATYVFVSGDKGVVELQIKDTAVETITIAVTDTGAKTGTSNELRIGDNDVTVPDVVNETEASARTIITNEGFTVTVTNAYSHTISIGNVCGQSPSAGDSAPVGSEVTLYISIGPTIYVDGVNGDDSQIYISQSEPLKTVEKAIDTASDGDTIIILAGNYPENMTITKRVTIKAKNGTARIGQ